MEKFIVDVSYSQIAVFNSGLENPFNDWADQHVLQGFSWREESVSFKTLIEAGPMVVEVRKSESMPTPNGLRVITVPFKCPHGNKVEISSIADGQVVSIEGGNYQLIFETDISDDQCWSRFTFIPNGSKLPEILIADTEIDPTTELIMHAEEA
ncbi:MULTISPECIES: competence protein ComJ [Gimesia]|uniref:competence protein ComJ n=1 Tax=Gimesia TaxID=1649453 RepID=UPI001188AD47|nr:competence protein ComJ [Gimesia panareensis]QDU47949.1 Competence protein J (ComJ) [Gimesia panareensis]